MWAAIVVVATAVECNAFNEAHQLQEQYPLQCILVDLGTHAELDTIRRPAPRPLAPFTSIRPRPRPTGGAF